MLKEGGKVDGTSPLTVAAWVSGAKAAQQIYPRPVGVGGGCGGSIQQDLKSIWETAKDGEGALPLRPGEYCVQERRGKGNARLPWPRLQIISAGKSYINAPVMVFRPLRPLCRAAHLAKAIWGGWRVASDPFGAAARPPAVILLGFGLQWGQVTPTLNKRAKGVGGRCLFCG